MGRGALVLLLSIGSVIMKVLWVALVMVLVLAVVAEAKKKPKPKPKGKGKPSKPSKPNKPSKCKNDTMQANPKLLIKEFGKYTVMKKVNGKVKPDATAPCWWDRNRTDCAKCKPGGEQCGFPMHRWCQASKPKKGPKTGCKGIPNLQTPREDSRATGTTQTSAVPGACLKGSSARMMPSLKSAVATVLKQPS